jgi:hypothetical protein
LKLEKKMRNKKTPRDEEGNEGRAASISTSLQIRQKMSST